nr:uncharacterized protein LOC105731643 [Aotus nancymaae]XP_012328935.1 uncharacterized protein LOC105731643 [Aotus nancymaae]XP_012328937.1 uncharacterized protein LOC105731643 [Aotus nancymaae]XP_021528644.1 uncharacterized protein LOC105731643 [Aotus nancymaae]XP_021528645.1 uncharacterized protein LOC105731643 [Aotus nancymaae]
MLPSPALIYRFPLSGTARELGAPPGPSVAQSSSEASSVHDVDVNKLMSSNMDFLLQHNVRRAILVWFNILGGSLRLSRLPLTLAPGFSTRPLKGLLGVSISSGVSFGCLIFPGHFAFRRDWHTFAHSVPSAPGGDIPSRPRPDCASSLFLVSLSQDFSSTAPATFWLNDPVSESSTVHCEPWLPRRCGFRRSDVFRVNGCGGKERGQGCAEGEVSRGLVRPAGPPPGSGGRRPSESSLDAARPSPPALPIPGRQMRLSSSSLGASDWTPLPAAGQQRLSGVAFLCSPHEGTFSLKLTHKEDWFGP